MQTAPEPGVNSLLWKMSRFLVFILNLNETRFQNIEIFCGMKLPFSTHLCPVIVIVSVPRATVKAISILML